MTRPVRQKEADAVDALLRNIAPVVEEPTTITKVDRYAKAKAKVDRYAKAKKDRYAKVKVDRYAKAKVDRYAIKEITSNLAAAEGAIQSSLAGKGSRKRILKTTIVLVEPPPGFEGDMLYLPTSEFERAYDFEYSNWTDLWNVGHVLDFTEAAEAAWETQGLYGEIDDAAPGLLTAVVVSELAETFDTQSEIWGEHSSEFWPEAMALARKIRAQLAADPDLVVDALEDYRWAGIIAGNHNRRKIPDRLEVWAALSRSTSKGLGAAAIDLIVWNGTDRIPEWRELDGLMNAIRETDWVPESPLENLILDSADLHPHTLRIEGSYAVWYELFGEYAIAGIEYHSDLARTQPYGWRNCRLVPHGTPNFPKFLGGDGSPSYPQVFIDRAQGVLFDED